VTSGCFFVLIADLLIEEPGLRYSDNKKFRDQKSAASGCKNLNTSRSPLAVSNYIP
jgi:hypothetical protein